MKLEDKRYNQYALVREMMESPEIIRRFDYGETAPLFPALREKRKLFLTGEGSSRIFPAKNMASEMLKLGGPISLDYEGARQAHEYDLKDFVVFGASNSGKTKEVISLFQQLDKQGHSHLYALTANTDTPLEKLSTQAFVLSCGKEDAVAATKSVVEQGLFYQSLLCAFSSDGCSRLRENQQAAAEAATEVLEMDLDRELVEAVKQAPVIFFAGRNNGVAEELTLKTNEIVRKKSDFLEGTYAVHGIEEVMNPADVVIVIDPFPEEMEKFQEVLVKGVGMKVFAVSSNETPFPTVRIPSVWGFETFLQLLAGWNILVEVGIESGIDLDKPQRARKVGNEFVV